tara:strand:- start:1071 stop:1382 length:312 start_codon:yes stop_codon:yes gene_type:complete
MKFLAIILSFYFLGLNLVPCEDAVELSGTDVQVQELTQDMEFSTTDTDDCSPFCQCHCCHVNIARVNITSFSTIETPISILIIQKGENSGQEIPQTHFQPPRI